MREISLDRLRTLVTVADNRSFAEAARILHLAPPTVSLHIHELEERIGAPLLSRRMGHIRPTAIGETLLLKAKRLLADTEQALDDIQRQVQGLEGRVRLGASTGVLVHLVPRALEALAREHPSIDVQVSVLTSRDTLARLADGALDIGPVALPQPPVAGLVIKPWRRDPIRAILPATWQCPALSRQSGSLPSHSFSTIPRPGCRASPLNGSLPAQSGRPPVLRSITTMRSGVWLPQAMGLLSCRRKVARPLRLTRG